MKCIKKSYLTEKAANDAKDYHNIQATVRGWKIMKGVYFCNEHKAWHITTRSASDIRVRLRWLDNQGDGGERFIKERNKMWDHYMEICQKKLLLPDGTYRKPDAESHEKLMHYLVGDYKKYPLKFKYVEMWWRNLPPDKRKE